jgi:hypothetical protein
MPPLAERSVYEVRETHPCFGAFGAGFDEVVHGFVVAVKNRRSESALALTAADPSGQNSRRIGKTMRMSSP